MLDGIIVGVLLLGAVVYLTRRFYRIYQGKESCACGGKCQAGDCVCGCSCSQDGACHCSTDCCPIEDTEKPSASETD